MIKLQYDLIIWEKSILKKCLHFVEIVLKSILKIRGNGAFKVIKILLKVLQMQAEILFYLLRTLSFTILKYTSDTAISYI